MNQYAWRIRNPGSPRFAWKKDSLNTITVSEAFSNAPPRSPAVLCLKGSDGATDMILADWFTYC